MRVRGNDLPREWDTAVATLDHGYLRFCRDAVTSCGAGCSDPPPQQTRDGCYFVRTLIAPSPQSSWGRTYVWLNTADIISAILNSAGDFVAPVPSINSYGGLTTATASVKLMDIDDSEGRVVDEYDVVDIARNVCRDTFGSVRSMYAVLYCDIRATVDAHSRALWPVDSLGGANHSNSDSDDDDDLGVIPPEVSSSLNPLERHFPHMETNHVYIKHLNVEAFVFCARARIESLKTMSAEQAERFRHEANAFGTWFQTVASRACHVTCARLVGASRPFHHVSWGADGKPLGSGLTNAGSFNSHFDYTNKNSALFHGHGTLSDESARAMVAPSSKITCAVRPCAPMWQGCAIGFDAMAACNISPSVLVNRTLHFRPIDELLAEARGKPHEAGIVCSLLHREAWGWVHEMVFEPTQVNEVCSLLDNAINEIMLGIGGSNRRRDGSIADLHRLLGLPLGTSVRAVTNTAALYLGFQFLRDVQAECTANRAHGINLGVAGDAPYRSWCLYAWRVTIYIRSVQARYYRQFANHAREIDVERLWDVMDATDGESIPDDLRRLLIVDAKGMRQIDEPVFWDDSVMSHRGWWYTLESAMSMRGMGIPEGAEAVLGELLCGGVTEHNIALMPRDQWCL